MNKTTCLLPAVLVMAAMMPHVTAQAPSPCSDRNIVLANAGEVLWQGTRCVTELEVKADAQAATDRTWLYGAEPKSTCTVLEWLHPGSLSWYGATCYDEARPGDAQSATPCTMLTGLESQIARDLCGASYASAATPDLGGQISSLLKLDEPGPLPVQISLPPGNIVSDLLNGGGGKQDCVSKGRDCFAPCPDGQTGDVVAGESACLKPCPDGQTGVELWGPTTCVDSSGLCSGIQPQGSSTSRPIAGDVLEACTGECPNDAFGQVVDEVAVCADASGLPCHFHGAAVNGTVDQALACMVGNPPLQPHVSVTSGIEAVCTGQTSNEDVSVSAGGGAGAGVPGVASAEENMDASVSGTAGLFWTYACQADWLVSGIGWDGFLRTVRVAIDGVVQDGSCPYSGLPNDDTCTAHAPPVAFGFGDTGFAKVGEKYPGSVTICILPDHWVEAYNDGYQGLGSVKDRSNGNKCQTFGIFYQHVAGTQRSSCGLGETALCTLA